MGKSLKTEFSGPDEPSVPLWKKLIYGSGDWGRASYNTLRQIFYAIFLTDVVGLDPRLASVAALVSILWDAINDPLVGSLSDRVKSRWGRRRPFLLIFSLPFALAFICLWWAPPWQSEIAMMIHVTLAYMLADTIQTLVTVPYLAMTPDLAQTYNQRTSLTTYRMFFNLAASLLTAVAAPMILDTAMKNGFTQQHGFMMVALLFGLSGLLPYLVIFFTLKERELDTDPVEKPPSVMETIRVLWQNRPFRYASGIYVLNWITVDIVALMLPFYLLYWIGRGDLLAKINVLGEPIALESVVIGAMLLTATLFLPFWNRVAQRFGKRIALISGMAFWVVVQFVILFVQPGQTQIAVVIAIMAGISVSVAHVMPEAIFPDVIDWDEIRTKQRREGVYYGAISFIRKLSSALASFLSLQALGWFGYQTPPANTEHFMQPESALTAIRLVTGPGVVILLLAIIVFALKYPLSRRKQMQIDSILQRRHARQNKKRTGEINHASHGISN